METRKQPIPTGFTCEDPEGELKELVRKKKEMQAVVRDALKSQMGQRERMEAE